MHSRSDTMTLEQSVHCIVLYKHPLFVVYKYFHFSTIVEVQFMLSCALNYFVIN